MRHRLAVLIALLAFVVLFFEVIPGRTAGPEPRWWGLGSGGNSSSSTNFRLDSTAGQAGVIGVSGNVTNRLEAGLWFGTSDRDGDGQVELTDNCPTVSNPGQENNDLDTLGDVCDPDDDNDGSTDTFEGGCGTDPLSAASVTPERVDGAFAGTDEDGDTLVDEPLPPGAQGFDCDGDGYVGSTEAHVFTTVLARDQDPCGTTAWPSDFISGSIPDSTNRVTIGDLANFVAPSRYLGTNVGTNSGDERWDISPGKGPLTVDINVLDLAALVAGPSGYPPMFSGARAFSGPSCPWPP